MRLILEVYVYVGSCFHSQNVLSSQEPIVCLAKLLGFKHNTIDRAVPACMCWVVFREITLAFLIGVVMTSFSLCLSTRPSIATPSLDTHQRMKGFFLRFLWIPVWKCLVVKLRCNITIAGFHAEITGNERGRERLVASLEGTSVEQGKLGGLWHRWQWAAMCLE